MNQKNNDYKTNNECNPRRLLIPDQVNRSAMMLIPKGPYHSWARCVKGPDDETDPVVTEIHLLPRFDSWILEERYIRENFDLFFRDKLLAWCADTDLWPANRTYEMFCDWFDITIAPSVYDLLDESLFRESEETDWDEFTWDLIRFEQFEAGDFKFGEYFPLN